MLYEFYGNECPHCVEMLPLVEKLEKELGVHVEKLETWNNEENAKKMDAFDCGQCGGVPFFYNDVTQDAICGSCDEDRLRAWMLGKK